jgi:CSLREA domain-containing protein
MAALRVGLLVTLGALALAPAAGAATIAPNITTDEDTANGDCSLREAVTAANTDGVYGGCVAADDDADTIVLQAGATYELSLPGEADNANLTGDLDVRFEELTIESSGAGKATIDGGDDPANIGRVLELGPSPDFVPAVTLNRLTITKGDQAQGGGLWASSAGSVTINESAISDNDGSAGAGMRVNTPMIVNDSTISGNSSAGAGLGGGIWVETGNLALNRSSVSGNVTGGMGGGLVVQNGAATVTNSTIANNFAAGHGGNIWSTNTLNLRSSTIANGTADSDNAAPAGDGGGIFIGGGTTTARNTVLANNIDVSSVGNEDCFGTLTSEGYNLIDQSAGCTIAGDPTGNLLDTDPQLGAFGGGPTPTYAHPSGGPLEDAGNPAEPGGADPLACPATDQRGEPRDDAVSRCDIGAYERQPPVLTAVGDKTVQAGQTLSFAATATDADAVDTLTFSSLNLPPGAIFDVDGNFTWTPTAAQVGTFSAAELIVNDGSLSDSELIDITVTAVPPPTGGGGGSDGGSGDTGTAKPKKCKKKKAKKRGAAAKKKKCKKKKKRK